MLFLVSIVLSLLIILISLIIYKFTFWSRQGIPNDLSTRSDLAFHLSDLRSHRKYGKVVGFYELWRPCLSVADPNLIKQILVTDFHKFADHRTLAGPNEPFRKSLFFLEYPKWRRIRAILSPSFTQSKQKLFKPLVTKTLDKLVDKLEPKAKNKEIIDLRQYFDCFTFDVISKIAFGLNLDTINDKKNPIFESAKSFFQSKRSLKMFLIFLFPKLSQYFDYLYYEKQSQQIIISNIKRVINHRIEDNIESQDFLQLAIDSSLLSNKHKKFNSFEKLTEEEIVSQSINILGAGYETTATQLCFIAQQLALNPEYHKILLDEIESTFEDISDINYEKLMKMQYLDAFIKEVMRINCSVNRIDRVATTDCYLDNIFIPKGTSIIIPVWTVHLDPDNFEEPDKFRPERFLPENQNNIKDYTFIPFASGPRNCIGMRFALMELKYCLVSLITKFKFELCDQTKEQQFYKLNQVANMDQMMIRIVEKD